MAVFEVEREGEVYEVDAPSQEAALKAFSSFAPQESGVQPLVPNEREHQLPPEMQQEANESLKVHQNEGGLTGFSSGLAHMGGVQDHFNAAVSSVLPIGPSRFGQYKDNLELSRQMNDVKRSANPKSFGAGNLSSTAAGLGRVAGAGGTAMKLVPQGLSKGKAMAATTTALAADGAVIGGADAVINDKDFKKTVGEGALFGGGSNVLLRGVASPIASRLTNMFRSSKDKAANAVLETARKSGKTPQEVEGAFASARADGADEFMLLDALGDQGVKRANQVSRSGGEGSTIVREALDARQAGQSGRVVNQLDEAFEAGGKTAASTTDDMTKNIRATNNANYAKVPDGPVKLTETKKFFPPSVAGADDVAKAKLTKSEKTLNKYRDVLGANPSSQRLIEIRREIAGQSDKAYRSGDGYLGGKLKDLKTAIDADLEAVSPAYKEANAKASEMFKVRDQVKEGQEAATRGRADDVTDSFKSMSGDQQQAFRSGMGDKLAGRAEGQAVGANAARPLLNDRFKSIAKDVVPNSDKLMRQLKREQDMFLNRNRITGGSQTADNLSDMVTAPTMTAVLRGDFKFAVGNTLVQAKNKLTGMNESTRKEIATMMTSRTNDAYVLAAAKNLERGKKLSAAQTRLVYGAIIMSTQD